MRIAWTAGYGNCISPEVILVCVWRTFWHIKTLPSGLLSTEHMDSGKWSKKLESSVSGLSSPTFFKAEPIYCSWIRLEKLLSLEYYLALILFQYMQYTVLSTCRICTVLNIETCNVILQYIRDFRVHKQYFSYSIWNNFKSTNIRVHIKYSYFPVHILLYLSEYLWMG